MDARRDSLTTLGASLLAAGAAWPVLVSLALPLTLSPYQRLARSAWCGSSAADASLMLGHCAICWQGAAALALTGALLLSVRRPLAARTQGKRG